MSVDNELQQMRVEIDAIDRSLVKLLSERAQLIQRVARVKTDRGLPIYAPERETELIRNSSRRGRCGGYFPRFSGRCPAKGHA